MLSLHHFTICHISGRNTVFLCHPCWWVNQGPGTLCCDFKDFYIKNVEYLSSTMASIELVGLNFPDGKTKVAPLWRLTKIPSTVPKVWNSGTCRQITWCCKQKKQESVLEKHWNIEKTSSGTIPWESGNLSNQVFRLSDCFNMYGSVWSSEELCCTPTWWLRRGCVAY